MPLFLKCNCGWVLRVRDANLNLNLQLLLGWGVDQKYQYHSISSLGTSFAKRVVVGIDGKTQQERDRMLTQPKASSRPAWWLMVVDNH